MTDWDRRAIDEVAYRRIGKQHDWDTADVPESFWELVNIHDLIWWCMDVQRDFARDVEDRKMIALITAVLNDVRDSIKSVIMGTDKKHYGNSR